MKVLSHRLPFHPFILSVLPLLTTTEPASATGESVSVYTEQYNAQTGRLSAVDLAADPGVGGNPIKVEYYGLAWDAFKDAVEGRGKSVHLIQDKDRADFQLVFVDIPLVYTESDTPRQIEPPTGHRGFPPPLPVNKHAASSAGRRELTSPWLRATLYTDRAGDVVGGVIVGPMAEYARLDELYHAARGEWEALASEPRDTKDRASVDPQMFDHVINEFEKNLIRRRPPLDENSVQAVFAPKGEQAMVLGRLAFLTPKMMLSSFAGPVRQRIRQCLEASRPFYRKLFDSLFVSLLTSPPTPMAQNQHYNFLPSTRTLRELAAASGDYNCFSPAPNTVKEAKP